MTKSQQKRAITIALAFISILFYAYIQHRPPKAEEGTIVTETDSTIITSTVTSSKDSAGQVVYTTERKVEYKQPRAKGIEIPAYLTDRDEEIVQHAGFTLSYNRKHLVANWVAWVLTPQRVNGKQKRADNFQSDTSIKNGPVAEDSDYRRSGYSRGHMCPSGDCKDSRTSQNECFYLSNMCPQTSVLNAGDWNELESKCRSWARRYDQLYIICGPIIEKGHKYKTIGKNNVLVPEQFFKVVMRYEKGHPQMIAYIMNNNDERHPLDYYAVTVDSVEARTGINFFSKLPEHEERKAEASFDLSLWK